MRLLALVVPIALASVVAASLAAPPAAAAAPAPPAPAPGGAPPGVAGAHAVPAGAAPVYDADAPDPDVIRVSSTYYAYTTGSHLRNIQVLESSDLHTWRLVGDAVPQLPSWTVWGETWAPGVVSLAGRYVMYYATEVAATGQQCISMAISTTPAGPFVDTSAGPFVCQAGLGGSIDPQPFVNDDGTPYLYWKSNGGSSTAPADIWASQLTPDGTGLVTAPVPVLTQDGAWESTIESPAMVEVPGAYVLFYSGGLWDSAGYGVADARCTGPLGPCVPGMDAPVLHSDRYRLGPGGESLVQDASGGWWMAYAAWNGPASDYSYAAGDFRSLWVAPVTFNGATPTIGDGEAAEGYRLVAGDGGVFAFGAAGYAGSMGGQPLAAPVVAGSATAGYAGGPAPPGYQEAAADGGVFALGDAPFFGSMGGRHLDAPVVGMAAMPQGGGYWLVSADGGVFAFGAAEFFGSTGGERLTAPVVTLLAGPGSGGYWLVGADGGVFAFGDAQFLGSMGGRRLVRPVVTGIGP